MMVKSAAGTITVNWGVVYNDGTAEAGGYYSLSTSVTLWTLTGIAVTALPTIATIWAVPVSGAMRYAEVGATDGTGGGTVPDTARSVAAGAEVRF
jgi:hypothetical protein